MSEIERRKAVNEAVFRNVNERSEALQRSFAMAEREPLQMICECDRLDCMERVAVGVDAYELIRAHPAQFFVTPGHEDTDVDEVITVTSDYLVVRKKEGDAHDVAVETNPRA
jgi:hypothetical protein